MRVRHRILVALLVIMLLAECTHRQPVVEQPLTQGWMLTGDTLINKLSVTVPSVVQQNLYDAGLIPHP